MVVWFAMFYTMKWRKPFYASLSTILSPIINSKITPSISTANYSPLSSERGWGWGFVCLSPFHEGAGGEALFASLHSMKGLGERLKGAGVSALSALHYFPFNYQPRHAHNCFISQLRWYCAIVSMDEFRNINVLMGQLGTSCSFDSPGLARNEPTPGKRSQGDWTP